MSLRSKQFKRARTTTLQAVQAGEDDRTPSKIEEERTTPRGKRDDHEYLPPEIRAIYEDSWKLKDAIRTQHILLKEYEKRTKDKKEKERLVFVRNIVRTDKEYRKKWEIYDKYEL